MDELRDPRLQDALRARAATETIDTEAAHDRVLRRASTIRRRRATLSGAGALVLIVAGATLWLRGAGDGIDTVPATDATVATTVPSSVTSTPATVADATTATTVETATTVTAVSPPPTPTPAPPAATTSPTVDSATTSNAPPAAAETKTFTSPGGSITVASNGGSLALVSVDPAAGYSEEIEDQRADRVRVRFRTTTESWRIEVRLEGGRMVETISN